MAVARKKVSIPTLEERVECLMAELEDALEALAAERRPEGMPQGVIRRKKSSGASQFYGPINYPLECTEGPPLSSGDPRPASSSPAGLPSPTPLAGSGNLFNPSMPPSIAVGDLVSEGCLLRMEARNCFLICYSDDALLCVYVYHATQKWSV